jgi:hypothetical protein
MLAVWLFFRTQANDAECCIMTDQKYSPNRWRKKTLSTACTVINCVLVTLGFIVPIIMIQCVKPLKYGALTLELEFLVLPELSLIVSW